MSWGLLSGIGQGMQQVGGTMQTNAQDQIKEQRVKEWQQKMRSEDRAWQQEDYSRQRTDALQDYGRQRTDKLSDYEMQRGHAIEDRDIQLSHAEKLANIRAQATSARGGGAAAADPRIKAWESERDYLREKADSSGLSAAEEDQLWYLEGTLNDLYSIPRAGGNQLPPSVMQSIDAQVQERFRKNPESPEAMSFRDTLINQHNSSQGSSGIPTNIGPIVDPDAMDDGKKTGQAVDKLLQFNRRGLISGAQGNDWEAKNAEYERKKGQIESVRNALKRNFPLQPNEYEEVYHLLTPQEQAKLDNMVQGENRSTTSSISGVIFPQYNNR